MKKIVVFFTLVFAFSSCCEKQIDKDKLTAELDVLIDNWHQAAAVADEDVFFGTLDSNAVYLGTDPGERWLKHEFMDWGMKYFHRDTAWVFKPYNRVWEFSDDYNYAWFDELLETHMGVCRGSGIVKNNNGIWKIKHYNLAVTLANEKMNDFRKIQGVKLR